MKPKTKRIIKGLTIGLISSMVFYFGLGIVSVLVATEGFINVRNCDMDLLEDDFYRIQKCRKDYPSLAIREEIKFMSNGESLQGYLYENPSPKGVIVFSHGLKCVADAYMSQLQDYYVRHNYDVFSFDMTGCGLSGGKGAKSLYESTYCIIDAVKTVQSLEKTKDLPIFLLGHSWGAYGSVVASNKVEGISAVCSFSAYDTPNGMFYGSMELNTSKAAILLKPMVEFGLYVHWGNEIYVSAEDVIKSTPKIPYIVIHGSVDGIVPFKDCSLYDNIAQDNYSNVTLMKMEGMNHSTPWKTLEAENITSEYGEGLNALRKKYHNNLPNDVKEEYLSSLDLNKSSEVNEDLLNKIDEIFTASIN